MKKHSLILTLTLATAAFSGCVSSSKHKAMVNDLQDQLMNERRNNKESRQELSGMEQKLIATAKDKGQLQSSLDEMKKAMEEMRARQAEERKRLEEFADLTRRFKRLTDAGTLKVNIIDGKMVVSLGSDLLFAPGSARLSKEGIAAVKEVATQLNAIEGKRYQVEGHTDNVPIATSSFPSNWELASARAISVVKTMIEGGMDVKRVSAASYGDTSPVQPNDTAEGKAANRRVAIVIVPDLSKLPGYDELQKASQ
jgi:chemotaxis protein MotB